MRRRRVALYDDEKPILDILTDFFEGRDYEVLACREPASCPLYEDAARCGNRAPCSDLIITDYAMPHMTGLEMLRLQARRGCRLTPRNKALISGHADFEIRREALDLGCGFFTKPFRLGELAAWVDACEERMDLSQSLGFPRKEKRSACCSFISYQEGSQGDLRRAEVVNRSPSGLCIRSERPHAVRQVVTLRDAPAASSRTAVVRWTRTVGADTYLVGLSCC